MKQFFEFEADFVASLRCIPMIVRFKLDTCGVKLKLHHWYNFNHLEKEVLINKPCETFTQIVEYRQYLRDLVYEKTKEYPKDLEILSNPEWLNIDIIPDTIQKKAKEFDYQLTLFQWQKLTPLQRFALIKLSRPSHENNNFLPALKEFELVS
ncbi:nitrate reductase associated protein [Geminocystis sp. NIES-3709]|uniref:nitrate reductase associated protein n=1 Tax=Geminocystis sp. NIES-3709 TaxID=1617448 RepID=UPI0005FC3CC1|nr:nitrate reductase associated protein [Geminocystis sp. NIES-3709]BAQ64472.1 nitrate reductase associated protein [Geminocystis sp. NIES-3709]